MAELDRVVVLGDFAVEKMASAAGAVVGAVGICQEEACLVWVVLGLNPPGSDLHQGSNLLDYYLVKRNLGQPYLPKCYHNKYAYAQQGNYPKLLHKSKK